MLAYLSRYTHRVAISNRCLIAAGADGVTFTYKDYRLEGPERYKAMTLAPHEFIGHTLPYLISSFWSATAIAAVVVVIELLTIAWIQWRFMETPEALSCSRRAS